MVAYLKSCHLVILEQLISSNRGNIWSVKRMQFEGKEYIAASGDSGFVDLWDIDYDRNGWIIGTTFLL